MHRQVQDMVKGLNPILGAALVHRWAGVCEKQVAHRDGALLRKIHQRVAGGVSSSRKVDLGEVWIEMNRELLLKRNVGRPNTGTAPLRLSERECMLAGPVGGNHG